VTEASIVAFSQAYPTAKDCRLLVAVSLRESRVQMEPVNVLTKISVMLPTREGLLCWCNVVSLNVRRVAFTSLSHH
jgi:hypothetical protein